MRFRQEADNCALTTERSVKLTSRVGAFATCRADGDKVCLQG